MNTTVYLIRHGEVEYQLDEKGRKLIYGQHAHLSSEGEKQIARLAQKLKKEGVRFDVLYTSPYRRAIQSAEIIFSLLDSSHVRMRKGLRDVWSPGWVGVTMEELENIGGNVYSQPPRSEDQETMEEMTHRIVTTFHEILKETRGKTIGIMGHGDPTRVLVGTLIGENPIRIVRDEWYYGKEEAWKLEFDSSLHLIESPKLIQAEGRISASPERKVLY